jgi:hypothetical protein
MAQAKNAFEIFQCLEKSNCRECGEKTCLAFAGAVFLGHRKITECPRLIPEAAERFAGKQVGPKGMDTGPEDRLDVLKSEVPRCDLEDAARRVGGKFSDNRLILKVLGRDFRVDTSGNLFAEIHINPWVAVPFLQYILHGKGLAPTGRWVSFRDLKGGRESHPLFQKRCEEAMKRVADTYPRLFDDMVHIFGGRAVEKPFESDVAVVLDPLPKVPIMICYRLPEEGLPSSLHVFFDETADRNLDIGSVFTLGTGLATMFTKVGVTHGFGAPEQDTGFMQR